MSKANSILRSNQLTEGLLDLMTNANKAIMKVYEEQNAR